MNAKHNAEPREQCEIQSFYKLSLRDSRVQRNKEVLGRESGKFPDKTESHANISGQ